jgi:hypothetical protein
VYGTAAFVRATRVALELLGTHDPKRAELVASHVRWIVGLRHRDLWRVGRATLYDRDRAPLSKSVGQAWIDRRAQRCYVTPRVWDVPQYDRRAVRRYAGVLVHEAAHIYLDTHDEALCNAEMELSLHLLGDV